MNEDIEKMDIEELRAIALKYRIPLTTCDNCGWEWYIIGNKNEVENITCGNCGGILDEKHTTHKSS